MLSHDGIALSIDFYYYDTSPNVKSLIVVEMELAHGQSHLPVQPDGLGGRERRKNRMLKSCL